mmetsp:Transcript_25676/g.29369  ORF Transcript_25676/g.29369 Transcript_25676/m.29369 type:complete len:321 (+) Transcript_25676:62-1024(+)|eukprot:CAMPEP_0114996350 /NCGR_PEP_ID=MMETSP0216-20121206/14254_1 /TAXON_ID=223996 /ORGANISM="Protocruzia adherens, Strain Boccale" /LENGTH=320 /DNA_ID=CAMNT_0002360529 /DNA_START=31 /DNA_END=993 /DNA_ORIENTATION=-
MEETSSTKNWSEHQFVTLQKQIRIPEHVEEFKKSTALDQLMTFLTELQMSVKSKGRSQTEITESTQRVVDMLETLEKWIDEIPPLEQPMRFGNKAFKTWHARLVERDGDLLAKLLAPYGLENATTELKGYLEDSFGSPSRIDFGTGHEFHFSVFLLCLTELGVFKREEYAAVVHHAFFTYIRLLRKILNTYMLEPAGSHGVFGLDDYNFLTFLLGASELIDHPKILPASIHTQSVLDQNHEEFLYIGAIRFITEAKKGYPFGEHSPMLNDISGIPKWDKVASGLVKMFMAEVIGKFPVIKHFLFGSIISFKPVTPMPSED